jgi:hypothetical protein
MISNGKTLETISYGAAPCSCRLLLPSSSGFQARILDGALGSLEETFAISPAEPRPDDQVSIAARDPSEPAAKGPLFPFVDLRGYSPALQAKALGVLRRGAVYVSPSGSALTSATSEATVMPSDRSEPALKREGFPFHDKEKENILYLAFRWIGSEFTNAEGATSLGNLSEASLNSVRGVGLATENGRPRTSVSLRRAGQKEAGLVKLAAKKIEEKHKGKEGFGGFLSPSNFFKKRGSSKSQLRIERVLQTAIKPIDVEEHPFLVEFYFDGRAIPLTSGSLEATDEDDKKQAVTDGQSSMLLQGGALLDLGVIGPDVPDAPAKEILHTITIHLWDATRPDVVEALGDTLFSPDQQDLKQKAAPNVIL